MQELVLTMGDSVWENSWEAHIFCAELDGFTIAHESKGIERWLAQYHVLGGPINDTEAEGLLHRLM